MSHYRDLNKELVEQVQTMRKNMKLYCDEIVYLKGELLRNRETEIFLRKHCYNWAVNNFIQLIHLVQPDSEILPVLEEHINLGERVSGASTGRRQPWPTSISDARRRSSLLTREFQRSNSVINLRKSVCSTSPIRRSNYGSNDEEEEQNSRRSNAEEMEDDEVAGNDTTQREMPRTPHIENIIFEESDEKEDESYNCEGIAVESSNESVEEVSVNISEKGVTLNDITNILKTKNISSKTRNSQGKNINKKVPTKRTKKKILDGKENSSDEYITSKEDSDIDIAKKPSKITQKRNAEKSNKVTEEESLQEPRRCSNSRPNFDANNSFPLNQNHGQISDNEATLHSTTLVLNDMTMRNFKDVSSSTPNSRQNSLEATRTTQCETVSTVQTSSNTSNRPSRHCKPKNLAEQSNRVKLRNESEPLKRKYSRKTKSSSKTKK